MKFELKKFEISIAIIFVFSVVVLVKTSGVLSNIDLMNKFEQGNEIWQALASGYVVSFTFYMLIEFIPRYRRFHDNRDIIFNSLKVISKRNNDVLVTVSKALGFDKDHSLREAKNYKNHDDRILIYFDDVIRPDSHGPGFKFKEDISFYKLIELNYTFIKNEIDVLKPILSSIGAEELIAILYHIEHSFIYEVMLEYKNSDKNLLNQGFNKSSFKELCLLNKSISSYSIKKYRNVKEDEFN